MHHSPFILGVHVCAVLEQKLNDSLAVVAGSKVERCGVSPVQIATVDGLRVGADQRLRTTTTTPL